MLFSRRMIKVCSSSATTPKVEASPSPAAKLLAPRMSSRSPGVLPVAGERARVMP